MYYVYQHAAITNKSQWPIFRFISYRVFWYYRFSSGCTFFAYSQKYVCIEFGKVCRFCLDGMDTMDSTWYDVCGEFQTSKAIISVVECRISSRYKYKMGNRTFIWNLYKAQCIEKSFSHIILWFYHQCYWWWSENILSKLDGKFFFLYGTVGTQQNVNVN